MAYRVAKSILTLHSQLKRGAPRAAPPATSPDSWGTLGDILHDTTSDHVPHDFPGWGDNIVTAGDFPNVPGLGLDAHKVLDDIRRARDPRAKYGISNDRIFSNHPVTQDGVLYPAWTWRPYLPHDAGRDRHYEHGHLSVVGDARADGTQPWPTIGAPGLAGEDDDDMGATYIDGKINPAGELTNINVGIVEGGAADPREAWMSLTNDGDGDYALRLVWTSGDNNYKPLAFGGDSKTPAENPINDGYNGTIFRKGRRGWVQLPKNCVSVVATRQAIVGGKPVAPTPDHPAADWDLGFAIERGPVKR